MNGMNEMGASGADATGSPEQGEEQPATSQITLDKSDPKVADLFSDCKEGDPITLTIGYNGKTVDVSATVGADDDTTFSATISGAAPDAAAGGDDEGASDETGDADETDPAEYVRKMRGAKG